MLIIRTPFFYAVRTTVLLIVILGASFFITAQLAESKETTGNTPRLKFSQLKHEWIDHVVSANGRVEAFSSLISGVTELIDSRTKRTIVSLPQVGHLAMSDDGRTLLVGSNTRSLLVWNVLEPDSGRSLPIKGGSVSAVALTTDARFAAVGQVDGSVRVINVGSRKEIWSQNLKSKIWSLSFSADNKRLIATFGEGTLVPPFQKIGGSRVFNSESGRVIAKLDSEPGYAVMGGTLSHDGGMAFTYRDVSKGVSVWSVAVQRKVRTLLSDVRIAFLDTNRAGDRLVALDDLGNLYYVEILKNRILWKRSLDDGLPPNISKLFISVDGKSVVAVPKGESPLRLSTSDGATIVGSVNRSVHPIPIDTATISSVGDVVLTKSARHYVGAWSMTEGRLLAQAKSGVYMEKSSLFSLTEPMTVLATPLAGSVACDPASIIMSSTGHNFAMDSCDSSSIILEDRPSSAKRYISAKDYGNEWRAIGSKQFSLDGKYLAADIGHRSGGHEIMIFDAYTTKLAFSFNIGNRYVTSSGFTDDNKGFWAITKPTLDLDPNQVVKGQYVFVTLADRAITQKRFLPCGHGICWRETISVSRNGRLVGFEGEDGALQLWKVGGPTEDVILPQEKAGGVAFIPVFSCDEKYVLYGNSWGGLILRNVATGEEIAKVDPVKVFGRQVWNHLSYAISCVDQSILLLNDGILFQIVPGMGSLAHPIQIASSYGPIKNYSEATSGMLALATPLGVDLVHRGATKPFATLIALDDGSSLVTDSDGRFDTDNIERLSSVSWIMPDDPLDALPVEIFMRDYYQPRLLARLLSGEKPPDIRPLAELNRAQPIVKIVGVKRERDTQGRLGETVAVTVQIAGKRKAFGLEGLMRTGAYDLRLFRDGQLVAQKPPVSSQATTVGLSADEELQLWRKYHLVVDIKDGTRQIVFKGIRLPRRAGLKEVQFSAYAFNEDRVKSETDWWNPFTLPTELTPRAPRAYVVTVGVNAFEDGRWDLSYAANDATQLGTALTMRLQAQRNEQGQPRYEQVVWVKLTAEAYVDQEGKRHLTKAQANKAQIAAVLKILAGQPVKPEALKDIAHADKLRRANPEDLVIIALSTHGEIDQPGQFYLLPHDIGVNSTDEQRRAQAISNDDLSAWLQGLDAIDLVMIIDACHSAASVQSTDFKPGPMGSRGLGQLAYDKGMRILTATQIDQYALETQKTQLGLLSYALVRDGLEQNKADYKPKDEQIWLSEWLSYASKRVPGLYQDWKAGTIKGRKKGEFLDAPEAYPGETPALQQPALFDFAREHDVVIGSGTR